MSAGERSCHLAFGGGCPVEDWHWAKCNVDCEYYEHDGFTKPDTVSSKPVAGVITAESLQPPQPKQLRKFKPLKRKHRKR